MGAINEALIARVPLRTIAEQRSVSKTSLLRHRDAHIPAELKAAKAASEVAQADSLLAQVHALLGRAEGILDQAELAGNLSAATSAIREARATLELLAKLAGQLQDGPQVNIILTPDWMTMRDALLAALAPFPEARQAASAQLLELEGGF